MKTEAGNHFRETMGELISQLENFPALEFNEVPFPGSWTAGQVGEHLLRSYGVIKTLYGNVIPAKRQVNQKIQIIKDLFLDYTIKMESPEAILPSTENINKESLLTALESKISRFNGLIYTEDLSLICTDYSIPEYGSFTRLEWIYFTIYHTRRHLHQIGQIKSSIAAKA